MKQLVFLHGFATNSRIWQDQIREFSQNYEVMAPDLDLADLEHCRDQISSQIKDKAIVIGWSMGAQVAIDLYSKSPKKVESLILVSSTPKFIRTEDFPSGLPKSLLRNLERKMKADYFQGLQFFYGLMFNGKDGEGKVDGLMPPSPENAMKALQNLEDSDYRDELPKIKVPTLLIHGDKDQLCLPDSARYMAENIPGAEIEMFKGVGHAPFISEPKRFNKRLSDFICQR